MALSKVNIWRFRATGADGKPVESAPGMTTFTVKGPATRPALIEAARILLDSKRADAVNVGLPDPGYKLDEASIEPVGHTDVDVGFWVPPADAKPIDLPTDAAVREADRRLLQEKTGISPDNA